jgi:hypothetical protein
MARKNQPIDPHHPTVSNPDWVRQIYDRARQPDAWLPLGPLGLHRPHCSMSGLSEPEAAGWSTAGACRDAGNPGF